MNSMQQIAESAPNGGMKDTGVRAHIVRVTGNMAAALAFTAAVAALAYPFAQQLPQSAAPRCTIVAVLLGTCLLLSRHVRLRHKRLIEAGAIRTTRLWALGYAGLIGLTSVVGFTAPSNASIAGVFVVAAAAFATASLSAYGLKRELPAWLPSSAENLIVVEILIFSGVAFAMLMELVAWPHGVEYVRYVASLQPTAPADAGNEWVWSFSLVAYFALALAFYTRAIKRTYDPSWDGNIKTIPRGSLFPLSLLPMPFLPLLSMFITNPALVGYLPLARPSDKSVESHVGVLGAFAVYSRILVPLAIAVIFFWSSSGN
jgi:FtsH-binding integral membrane protein